MEKMTDAQREHIPDASSWILRAVDIAFVLAIAIPTLIAYNLAPSSTFFNQAAALVGWGGLVATLAVTTSWPAIPQIGRASPVLLVLGILMAAAVWSVFKNALPWSLALSAVGLMMGAAAAMLAGLAAGQSNSAESLFRGFCIGLLIAGLLGADIGAVQVFLPDAFDTVWLAADVHDGRASGNLRQPNHLSSLLIWSLVALAWLWQSKTLPPVVCRIVGLFLVFAIVLTGSRTGVVDCCLLVAWAVFDRRLPSQCRWALAATPLLYWLFWVGLTEWAHSAHHVFGGEGRFGTQGDISSSRLAIWKNTISLIAQHPWTGVGWGEFNFAWSLTPFPGRPTAFFDHTHNLALQFAVELGLPLAVLLMLLLGAGFVLAFLGAFVQDPSGSARARAAFMVVLTIGIHSMLEYPLWYAYFLLPAAFAWGIALSRSGQQSDVEIDTVCPARETGRMGLVAMGAALMIGGAAAVLDYMRVTAIFSAEEGVPLATRIERGQHSLFFAHHANYAAATTASKPSEQMLAFDSAAQNLLDTRLMIAWAKAFAERGDLERARHIAERLREFRNEDAKEFFAACEEHPDPAPFQCTKPRRAMDYRDFK